MSARLPETFSKWACPESEKKPFFLLPSFCFAKEPSFLRFLETPRRALFFLFRLRYNYSCQSPGAMDLFLAGTIDSPRPLPAIEKASVTA